MPHRNNFNFKLIIALALSSPLGSFPLGALLRSIGLLLGLGTLRYILRLHRELHKKNKSAQGKFWRERTRRWQKSRLVLCTLRHGLRKGGPSLANYSENAILPIYICDAAATYRWALARYI